mgnify:CR=1 FL=1
MARMSGFNPIISTASPRNFELVKSLGASHVLDRTKPLTQRDIEGITPKPITHIVDCVSVPETRKAALELLAPRGKVAFFTPAMDERAEQEQAAKEKKMTMRVLGVKGLPFNVELMKEWSANVTSWLERGELKVSRDTSSTHKAPADGYL